MTVETGSVAGMRNKGENRPTMHSSSVKAGTYLSFQERLVSSRQMTHHLRDSRIQKKKKKTPPKKWGRNDRVKKKNWGFWFSLATKKGLEGREERGRVKGLVGGCWFKQCQPMGNVWCSYVEIQIRTQHVRCGSLCKWLWLIPCEGYVMNKL